MQFAKTIGNSIISGTFEQLWPNTNANDPVGYALNHGFTTVSSNLPYDPVFEKLVHADVYFLNGTYYDVSIVYDVLDNIKARLHDKVAKARSDAETAGVSYTFPDKVGIIQTRNDIDIRNIQAQVIAALVLTSQNVTTAVMEFRDQANVTHMLTPAQMISMGMAVSSALSALYNTKWSKDAAIDNLASAQDAKTWNTNN